MRTLTRPPGVRWRTLPWLVLVLAVVAAGCSGSGAGDKVAEPEQPTERDSSPGEPIGAGWSEVDLLEAIEAADAASGRVTAPNTFESCGLRPDGELVCWGLDSLPWQLPEGAFAAVSTGLVHGCGLRLSGEVECWGQVDFYGETDPPEGRFAAIGSGRYRSCGVRLDGSVECWGGVVELLEGVEPPVVDVAFPGGVFTAVSVGGAHICGLRPSAEVACWGANWFGQADAPPGPFVAVDAGASHSCGLRSDGSVTCWGEDSLDAAELMTFGYWFGGDEQAYEADRRDTEARTQEFFEAFGFTGQYFGASDVVLLDLEGAVPGVELRREMARGAAGWEPPAGPFVAVSAGEGFTCGLRLDGEAECWGYYAREEPRIPLEVYADVYGDRLWDFHDAIEAQAARGLDGFVPRFFPLYESLYGARVWELDPSQYLIVGHNHVLRQPSVPSGAGREPEYLIAGPELIPVASMVAPLALIDPPPGPFVAVEAGQERACGLRPDGELECWGVEHEDSAPPPGPFATAPITEKAAAP